MQHDIVAGIVEMLTGAMAELVIGDPGLIQTDIGPVIDEDAREALERHGARMAREGPLLYDCELGKEPRHGVFFAPRLYRIERLDRHYPKSSGQCGLKDTPTDAGYEPLEAIRQHGREIPGFRHPPAQPIFD